MRTHHSTRLIATLILLALPAFADAESEDQFFDSSGVEIRYKTWGVGEPIVLIHGFTASIEANWELPGVVEALSQEFKVIALDTRGHGKSGKPHDPAAYGSNMADDVVRLLDHLGIEKANVVGYSMGGFITLDLVTRHPELLSAVVLGGAGWNEPNEGVPNDRLAESLESGEGLGPLFAALTPEGQPQPSAEQMTAMSQFILANNDPLALAAAVRGMTGIAPSEESVRSIEVPILAVVGELDPLRAGVDRLHEVLPATKVVVLDGKDHMSAIADPALPRAIRAFLIDLCKCA